MNDVLISCFRAATETLNFTTAAQNVHISQPSFSRNIAMLEEELGFKLFWRNKQSGIRLTPAGAALYQGMFDIEKRYNTLLEKSRQISRGEAGKLVIGILNGICLDSKSFYHIKRFQEEYPQVELELKSCSMLELETNLLKGICDISFMMANIIKSKDKIISEKVYSVPTYFVVPKTAGFDPTKTYKMSDLKDQVFLLSEEYPEFNERILQGCKACGFEPKVRMAPNNETKMLLANIGEGVTGATKDHYVSYSPHVSLIQVEGIHHMDFALCWSKDNYNPVIAMFDSLVNEVTQTY